MEGDFTINKSKTIFIGGTVLLILMMAFTFFEFFILKVLGLQYSTISALIIFFVIYAFLEGILSFVIKAMMRALTSVGIVKTSKGWLLIVFNTAFTFMLIELMDTFTKNISISWQGALIFAFLTALFNWMIEEKDEEPPMANSEAFKQIGEKFTAKK